ncbi:MAG: glycosyltransferase [Bacteroidales bacterium]|nr:glycosyltransferase [Bacteroidales bacterium]
MIYILILILLLLLVAIYLAYPLWLKIICKPLVLDNQRSTQIQNCSIILLSFNGRNHLENKIKFLLNEIKNNTRSELIIIDDNSCDGSKEIISLFANESQVKIILKEKRVGIPDTMNRGFEIAKNEILVFCDQRQKLSDGIINTLTSPLGQAEIGAVSACISGSDKANCISLIRKHENYLKRKESVSGNLIGVYGPLYAIKKEQYKKIPSDIILDDLYLSLEILTQKKIIFKPDCLIVDESLKELYDYKRALRYLKGYNQILKQKDIISKLSKKQRTMLFWHKYLRLLFPIFLIINYVCLGILSFAHYGFFIGYMLSTFLIIFSLVPIIPNLLLRVRNIIRINIYYLVAMIQVLTNYKPETLNLNSHTNE